MTEHHVTDALLSGSNLNLRFANAETPALDSVNIELQRGELLAVLGPNGAGKSTLLKVLAGELAADCGSVSFAGRELTQWNASVLAQHLAVLPQRSSLSFSFRVEDVVALGRYPHATGIVQDRKIVDQVLELADVSALRDRDYTTLSGGEQQRVHLARVLAQVWPGENVGNEEQSGCLLLDEPTAALDLAHQHLVLQVAKERARSGMAVLAVLHDLNLAAQYADRLLLLKDGKAFACGAPQQVLTVEQIQQVFAIDVDVMSHPRSGRPLIIAEA